MATEDKARKLEFGQDNNPLELCEVCSDVRILGAYWGWGWCGRNGTTIGREPIHRLSGRSENAVLSPIAKE